MINILKTVISAIISLVVFFVNIFYYPPVITDMPSVPDDFTPVIRFTVASDCHIKLEGDKKDVEKERVADMISDSYRLAQSDDTSYKNLDAIVFAGDITDNGEKEAFVEFKKICDDNIKDETELMIVLGNHDYYTDIVMAEYNYEKIFGVSDDFHKTLKGFHFIGVSPSIGGGWYDPLKPMWLSDELEIAEKDNPDYPIFVIQHMNVKNTIYGSTNWGVADMTATQSQYPQIINFSGHSHYPINDPRSVWQGSFTAVGTGTLSFFELEVDGVDGYMVENNEYAAQMWVVEADINGRVRMRAYDILENTYIGNTYFIEDPTDKSTFAYNHENMAEKSSAPSFTKSAKLDIVQNGDKTTSVTFPQATNKNDDIVFVYRITVKDSQGNTVNSINHLSGYYFVNQPTKHSVNLGKFENGTYTVSVTAENAFSKTSSTLTKEFNIN